MTGQSNNRRRQGTMAALALLAGGVLVCAPRFAAAAPPQVSPPAFVQSVVSSGPLTLTATIDSRVSEGQPADLMLKVRNNGPKTLIVGGSAFERSAFHLAVIDEKGHEASPTNEGHFVLTPPTAVTANSTVEIGSGQTLQYRFNLARLYDLSRPGVYTVSAGRIFGPWLFRFSAPKPGMQLSGDTVSLTAGPLKFQMVEGSAGFSGPVVYAPPPSHQTFLYMASTSNTGIVRYRVGADGGVSETLNPKSLATPAAPPSSVPGSGPTSLAATPNARFLYAGSPSRDVPLQYTVSQYRIGNDGFLLPLSPPALTVLLPAPQIPGPLLMDPKGRFLYNLGGALYAIGADGNLTLVTTASRKSPLTEGSAIQAYWGTIDPTGTFLFVYGAPGGGYRIGPDGTLTSLPLPAPMPPWPYPGNANALAFSPAGKFAVTGISQEGSNAYFDLLAPMHVGTDGSLRPIPGAAQTPKMPPLLWSGYRPFQCSNLAVDPSGRFLVVLNPAFLDCYRIEANGQLTFLNMAQPQSPLSLYSLFFVSGSSLVYVSNSNTSTLLSYRLDDKQGLVAADTLLPISTPFEARVASASAPTPPVWGKTVEGLAISVHLPADTLLTTQPVVLTATLKNTTNRSLRLGTLGTDMTAFRLSIQGSLLAAGRDLLKTPRKGNAPLILPPGGKRQYRFVLSRLTDLTANGDYTVQVTRTLPDGKAAVSPVLPLTLNDPPQSVRYGGKNWVLNIP